MEDYKSNSMKKKEEASTEKRVSTQIQGAASTKKKGTLTKFSEAFMPDDISNIKNYIISETTDILVTALKKCIDNTVHRMLYGKSSTPSNNNGKPSSGLIPYYKSSLQENSVPYRPTTGSLYSFDEVEFSSLETVEQAIRELRGVQERYGVVRVADMYDVAHLEHLIRWTDNNYGWTDIRSAHWTQYTNSDGEDRYILKMPRPLPL